MTLEEYKIFDLIKFRDHRGYFYESFSRFLNEKLNAGETYRLEIEQTVNEMEILEIFHRFLSDLEYDQSYVCLCEFVF